MTKSHFTTFSNSRLRPWSRFWKVPT